MPTMPTATKRKNVGTELFDSIIRIQLQGLRQIYSNDWRFDAYLVTPPLWPDWVIYCTLDNFS